MRFGLFGLNFGPCADPELAIRVAVAAEEAGFDSVWTGEHVAMPVRDNPVPTPAETPILDSLIALANVAAHTRRLRLGTGILVLPHHNPVLLAKALTTLDLVSAGRLIAGFGGWYGFGLTAEAAAPMVQELRRLRATTGRPPLEISLTTFEPLTPALVAQATRVGVDRLIAMPRVRGEQLEATVRALGAEFAQGG